MGGLNYLRMREGRAVAMPHTIAHWSVRWEIQYNALALGFLMNGLTHVTVTVTV